jgi:hypothetical protein
MLESSEGTLLTGLSKKGAPTKTRLQQEEEWAGAPALSLALDWKMI